MHEYGITESILKGLLEHLEREQLFKVVKVQFRRSSTFSEEVLRQVFDLLKVGTPLEQAELIIDVAVVKDTCTRCGQTYDINSEDLMGHMFVCPQCQHVWEVTGAHDLELVEVLAEQ